MNAETINGLTVQDLETKGPWEIAKRLGIGYAGDMNPIPHGGTYYSTGEWERWGYASGVTIEDVDGDPGEPVQLWVSSVTINKPDDLADCLACIGLSVADLADMDKAEKTACEIEAALAYCGSEQKSDYSGNLQFRYSEEFSDDFPESQVWSDCIGWITGLANS